MAKKLSRLKKELEKLAAGHDEIIYVDDNGVLQVKPEDEPEWHTGSIEDWIWGPEPPEGGLKAVIQGGGLSWYK